MYAFSGMVEWNEVSNTTTWGTSLPNALRQALIPSACALLCKGAKGIRLSISSITLSVTKQDSLNIEPPCTTLWPTAEISFISSITLASLLVKA